jgi:hypothetical protein
MADVPMRREGLAGPLSHVGGEREMIRCAMLVAVILTGSGTALGSPASMGWSWTNSRLTPRDEACPDGALVCDHDGSFESAYAWQGQDEAAPYYGAFAEAYDLGEGTITCGAFWLTSLSGWYTPDTADCYVWAGGVGSAPGAVLAAVLSVPLSGVPPWPQVNENVVEMHVAVEGAFAIGYWGPWAGDLAWYYCAADLDGPVGHPWTCIAPGSGYASGWQDPSIIWGPTRSMGLGVYFESNPTPAASPTWGAIKAMFRR